MTTYWKLLLCTENVLDSKTIRPNESFSMETAPLIDKIEKIGGDKVSYGY